MKAAVLYLLSATGFFFSVFCRGGEPSSAASEETVFHRQVRKAMPETDSFHRKGKAVWEILDRSGSRLGTLYLETVDDSQRTMGFGGPIEIAIVVNGKDEISGILVGKNQETPRFLKRVAAAGFLKKWNGMTLKKAAETDMDTVSGATYTSAAIASGVKKLAASLIGEDTGK